MGIIPVPQGQQREVVYLQEAGHCVVLGTAGSGKTVMAVHRARHLAQAPGIGGPTLLVTFNQSLLPYLRELARGSGVTIETYHRMARDFVAKRVERSPWVCDQPRQRKLLSEAIERVRNADGASGRAVLRRPVEFFLDELRWLTAHGITEPDAYTSGELERVGRGTKLGVRDRAVVWRVYQQYLGLRDEMNLICDWDDIPCVFRRMRKEEGADLGFRHVVVDEGQDFTPEMIRSLAEALPEDGSLTFFGDYAQQIYGSRMSWRSLGLRVHRTVEFTRNYRNSRQIAQLARDMTELPHFRDEVDLVESKEPLAEGLEPTLVEASTREQQQELAVKYANNLSEQVRKDWDDHRQVAILVPAEELVRRVESSLRLTDRAIKRIDKDLDRWSASRTIFYGSYRDARGLEFDAVVLPFCDADVQPDPDEIDALGSEEAHARAARELYVAVTRARKNLTLICSSELTELLPLPAPGRYERIDP